MKRISETLIDISMPRDTQNTNRIDEQTDFVTNQPQVRHKIIGIETNSNFFSSTQPRDLSSDISLMQRYSDLLLINGDR